MTKEQLLEKINSLEDGPEKEALKLQYRQRFNEEVPITHNNPVQVTEQGPQAPSNRGTPEQHGYIPRNQYAQQPIQNTAGEQIGTIGYNAGTGQVVARYDNDGNIVNTYDNVSPITGQPIEGTNPRPDLANNPPEETTSGGNNPSNSEESSGGSSEGEVTSGENNNEGPVTTVTPETPPQEVKEEAEEKADDIAKAINAGAAEKKAIKKATFNVFTALKEGKLDPSQAGYFLVDAIATYSRNRDRRDANYIENLSRAVHGDTILSYDINNDEKSKLEQLRNSSLEDLKNLNKTDIENDIGTEKELEDAAQKTDYNKAQGSEGMANLAGYNQAQSGEFNAITQGIAEGNPEAIKSFEALVKSPQTEQRLNELEKELREGTLDTDIKQAYANYELTDAQISQLEKSLPMLDLKGDFIRDLRSIAQGISNGTVDVRALLGTGLEGLLFTLIGRL